MFCPSLSLPLSLSLSLSNFPDFLAGFLDGLKKKLQYEGGGILKRNPDNDLVDKILLMGAEDARVLWEKQEL